eukprot:10285408-Karenia_brevis.AAC.1
MARYQKIYIVKGWDFDRGWERIGEFRTETLAREYIIASRPLWILSFRRCKIVRTVGRRRRLIQ